MQRHLAAEDGLEIVIAGFCAGVSPQAHLGEVFIGDGQGVEPYEDPEGGGERLLVHSLRLSGCPERPEPCARSSQVEGACFLLTVARALDTAQQKQQLAARGRGVTIADMESVPAIGLAKEWGKKVRVFRSVSDLWDEDLPLPAETLFPIQRQRPALGVLLAHCVASPPTAFRMLRFVFRLRHAAHTLGKGLEAQLLPDAVE